MNKQNLYFILAMFLTAPVIARADNVVHAGTPVLDRPTLMALGIQLPVTGDDNFNASVTVRYRVSGAATWRNSIPLYRVHPESVFGYTVSPQFAGSIIDLRPGLTYDIELHLTDPDGPVNQTLTLTGTTRSIPGDPANPRVRNVSDLASLYSTMASAQPGDVIVIANGVYTGNFGIGASGTAANPIVLRGASQDGVILDGGNCTGCNVLELYGSFVHVEQMTLRNGERAIRFQAAGSQGNVVRRVHITNVQLGIGGRSPQYDNYIADNILEGRLTWPLVYNDDGGAHSDDDGIAVTGHGMVIAHNRISGFGDAMKNQTNGSRAFDVYGNDVLYTYDNGVELDENEGNARALRNRFTNNYAPISVQPIYAGPAYILRNIAVNVVDEQIKFHAQGSSQPNGVFAYHNTFLSPYNESQVQTPAASHHFAVENNLFLGPNPISGYASNWDAPIDDGLFDYNGYFPDARFLFRWATSGYTSFANFAAMQAGGIQPHSRLMTGQIFANGLTAPTTHINRLAPQDVTPASGGPAIDKGVLLPGINDTFSGAAPDLGAIELGCAAPVYGPRPAGMDESNEPLGCDAAQPVPQGSAQFVRADTSTQGNWRSTYGAEGYQLAADGASGPSYGQVSLSGQLSYTWANSTTDVRALQEAANPNDRIAATWYSDTSFTIDVNLTGTASHQLALYLCDWDSLNRAQRVDVLDAGTGSVIDTRNVSSFGSGQYLVWNVTGHVQFHLTNTGSRNAVVLGIFFGGALTPPASNAAAQFVRTDTATQGNWRSVYGAEGYNLAADGAANPSYGQVSLSGQLSYTWANSTTDVRALQKAANPNDRIAATWYSDTSFTIDVNLTGTASHQLALYLCDWDSLNRAQRVDVLDAGTGSVIDTRNASSFVNGQYMVWNVTGHIRFRLTNTGARNAVVLGIFFGGALAPPASGATAQFVRTDTSTQGNWRSAYGAEGYNLAGGTAANPSYGQVSLSGQLFYTWANSTTDVRALQKAANPNDRLAATWYSDTSFTIDVNLTGTASHQLALYICDWDSLNRAQRVDVLDPRTGSVIDTRNASSFVKGQYLVWNVTGHVQFRLTNTGARNAVVSGIFFGGASAASSATVEAVTTGATTQDNGGGVQTNLALATMSSKPRL